MQKGEFEINALKYFNIKNEWRKTTLGRFQFISLYSIASELR